MVVLTSKGKPFSTRARLKKTLINKRSRHAKANPRFRKRCSTIPKKRADEHFVQRQSRAGTLPGHRGHRHDLGIFHRNYYDAFPLADDIMEPYRPFVDQVVIQLVAQKQRKLTKESKHAFLELFYKEVPFGEQMVQLGTCLTYTAASVAKFFAGETKAPAYPRVICG